ncbi:MAG: hypothetical protein HOP11_14320 [Saprospiraceae bacterium]|nr:hypothetical protein [Saprospiraceae bacterium]
MSNLSNKLVQVILENKSDPMARKAANLFRTSVIPLISSTKNQDIQSLNEFLREVGNQSSPINPDMPKREYRSFEFSPEEFGNPKKIPQPVPPADSEVSTQEAKEIIPFEKDIFELFSNGKDRAEESFKNIESFSKRLSELDIKIKKPKDFNDAWSQFEKAARKVLGI